jgi:hypothetical protein
VLRRLIELADLGDTVTWLWSTGGSIHSIAPENPQACTLRWSVKANYSQGPRCSSDPNRPSWFQSSPFWRGNNSVLFGLARYKWSVVVGDAGIGANDFPCDAAILTGCRQLQLPVPVEPSYLVQLPLQQPWSVTPASYFPLTNTQLDMRGNIVGYYPGANKVWDVTVDVWALVSLLLAMMDSQPV